MDMSKLTTFLNAELKRRDWSINELGRRANISASQAANVIAGRSEPGLEFCVAIADVFRVDPVKVLRMTGLLPPDPSSVRVANPALDECWHILTHLDDADLAVVVRMLRGLG